MIPTLFNRFTPNTTLLTPNQRLSATLLKKYNQHQQQQGKNCWPTADLLPLSTWIERLWDHYCSQEMESRFLLLNANQELILWEEIIREAPESEQLLKLSDLAKQAKSAWSTLKKWRSDFEHPSFSLTENSRAFQAWAKLFAQRCQQAQWVDSASLTDRLIEKIEAGKIPLPEQLILLNFTEITPQQSHLFQACRDQGMQLELEELSQPTTRAASIALNEEETELETMARWAKQILEQEPEATIGCIASELEEKRETIISLFNDIFKSSKSFNLSAGKTLAAYPILQQAIQLLTLPLEMLSFEALSSLLTSPYVGDAEREMLKRIQWESRLRRQNLSTLKWPKLLASLHPDCPQLAARLSTFLEKQKSASTSQKISQWVEHFSLSLEILGWPGEQSLNSAEYQVVKSWMDLLKEAALLDRVLPPCSANKALHYLRVLAAKTYFQPQSPEAPIQILGQLEGAGLPFDYLWVMGMDDTAWPPAPSPNPLLPHELQKRLQMPNASAERQLEYSLKLTKQFKQAAPTVIFSYAQHNDKEELRPSPLIADLRQLSLEDLALAPLSSILQTIFESRQLESFHDEQARALLASDKLKGGASLFEMQADCPFKAFARLRLNARPLEALEAGLPAKQRGTVIHRVLELLWKELGDQRSLLAWSEEKLEQKIKEELAAALHELAPFLDPESLYFKLVTQRLEKQLQEWFKLEKARPPFKVLAQEQEKTMLMNGLAFKLRVDRIDELADGGHLIIDYKTKKVCDTQDWFGQRPSEPQLPLYCLSNPEAVVALAFGQLHATQTGLKGLSQKALELEGLKPLSEKSKADAKNWEGQIEEWRLTLRQLFDDFQNGQAKVDPKDQQSCHYCDLQTLCRIHEQASQNRETL